MPNSAAVVPLPLAIVDRVGRATAVTWSIALEEVSRSPDVLLSFVRLGRLSGMTTGAAWFAVQRLEAAGLARVRKDASGRGVEVIPLRPAWLPPGAQEALEAFLATYSKGAADAA